MTRAARFVGVGIAGFAVQALALGGLITAGLPYPVATALAVEAAILHNFLWHELWTWGDRGAGLTRPPKSAGRKWKGCSHGRLARFLRFNGATAVVSIAGNVALMRLFAGWLRLPLLLANLLAVLSLSAVNFLTSDRLVFVTKLPQQQTDPTSM